MPRKKKEEVVELCNMEKIISAIKEKTENYKEILKFDGITIEFTCKDDYSIEDGEKEVKGIAKELKLKNYITERSKLDAGKFILQFPDMTPKYTEAEIKKLYKANFKWLLDDSLRNKPDLTKPFILEHTDNYVKLAVTTYYRSNVNQYKDKLEDYLNDMEYRQRLNALFRDYLDEYWERKN